MANACAFLRSMKKLVDDCSNHIQLRYCMYKFKHYIYIKEAREIFHTRVTELKGDHRDRAYDELLEEMEDHSDSMQNRPIESFEDIDTDFISSENGIVCPFELAIFKKVFVITNGNKVDICAILGLSNDDLNNKIKRYKLKEFLNNIRHVYRKTGYSQGAERR